MKTLPTAFLVLFLTLLCSFRDASASEAEVREAIQQYVVAFNAAELGKLESYWTENAVYIDNQLGERVEGRADIMKDISLAFERSGGLVLSGGLDHIRFIRDDVAAVTGETALLDGDESMRNRFSAILVKQEGTWKIASMEESAIAIPTAAGDALREVEWLVGNWSDESGANPVRTSIRWDSGHTFLLRSYEYDLGEAGIMRGTEIIGWDPRAQTIRSWSFNSDGSFGDGIWTESDGQWLVRSSQTLADGRAATGTYVITPVDGGSFTAQLIGRDIDGEPQPASAITTVVRVTNESTSNTEATTPAP